MHTICSDTNVTLLMIEIQEKKSMHYDKILKKPYIKWSTNSGESWNLLVLHDLILTKQKYTKWPNFDENRII